MRRMNRFEGGMTARGVVDALVPAPLRDGSDLHRRARILVVCLLLLFFVSIGFMIHNLVLGLQRDGQNLGLAAGAALMALNFLLLHRTKDPILVARIMCIEALLAVTAIARLGLGLHAVALRWLLIVPLLGGILVDIAFGFILSGGVCGALLWLYIAEPLPPPFTVTPRQMEYFELIGSGSLALALALCAAVFEGARRRANEDTERAMDALRGQQNEVEGLRAQAELARETAEAELLLKSEFVELMMRQAREQSSALDETRRAMSGVTAETRKIGESVSSFADAAKASNAAATSVDKLNRETQASIEDMTSAVEQNSASIEEMRMTLREVARHIETLLQNVESTSSAMTER